MKNFRIPLNVIFLSLSYFLSAFSCLSSDHSFHQKADKLSDLNLAVQQSGEVEMLGLFFSGSSISSIDPTFPTAGVFLCPGTTVTIQWLQSQVSQVDIEFSSDGGVNWTLIQGAFPAGIQQYQWLVPTITSSQCLIRLSDSQSSATSANSDLFSVGFPSFISPNGGETLAANYPYQISWSGSLYAPSSLEFSSDNGVTWVQIASGITGNSYFWEPVNQLPSTQCLLRLSDPISGNVLDITDTNFTIDNLILGTNTILTDSVVGTLCRQDTVKVYFSTSGSFGFGNQFIAQISNASGVFSNPVNIGAVSAQTGGMIHAIIPDSLPNGTAYYIRVMATNQPVVGSPYLIPLQLDGSNIDFSAVETFRVLPNDANVQLNFIGQPAALQTFSWDFGNGGTSNSVNTSHNYSAPGFYDISLTTGDASGCVQQRIKQDYIQVEVQFPSSPLSIGSAANAQAVDFIDSLKGCYAMSDGTCRITLDGGQTFAGAPTGAPGELKSVSLVPGQWMVAGEQGFVATSSSLGATWNTFNINFQGTIYAVRMSSPYRGILVGASGQAFYFDSIAWSPIPLGITETLYSVAFDGTVGFACGENGVILKFTVTAPSALNSGTNETLKGIYFSGSTVYAVGPAGLILKSLDGGNTFNTILGGLDSDLNAITGSGPDTVWAFGSKGLILQTFDGGNTWDRYTNGTLNDNNGGSYKAARRRGATAGNSGNALVFGSGGSGSSLREMTSERLSLFPNPTSDQLFLHMNSSGSLTSCRVFDALGMEFPLPVKEIRNGQWSVDVSSLAGGMYFVEAIFGTHRKIAGFVISR